MKTSNNLNKENSNKIYFQNSFNYLKITIIIILNVLFSNYSYSSLPYQTNTGPGTSADFIITQTSGSITVTNGKTYIINSAFNGSVTFEHWNNGGILKINNNNVNITASALGNNCQIMVLPNASLNLNSNSSMNGNSSFYVYTNATATINNIGLNATTVKFINYGTTNITNWDGTVTGLITNYAYFKAIENTSTSSSTPLVNYGDLIFQNNLSANNVVTNYNYLNVNGDFSINNSTTLNNYCKIDVGGSMYFTNTTVNNAPSSGTSIIVANLLKCNTGTVIKLNNSSLISTQNLECYGTIQGDGTTVSTVKVAGSFVNMWGSYIKSKIELIGVSTTAPAGATFQTGAVYSSIANSTNYIPSSDCSPGVGVLQAADLSIVKSVNNSTPNIGNNVSFTLTATNNGPLNATGVIVNDTLLSGYTFVSATPTVGTWSAPKWTIGSLNSGSSATLTIVATVKSTGIYANTAYISGSQTDQLSSNNISGVTLSPKCSNVSYSPIAGTYNVPQSISLTSATSGATIRYTTDGSTPSQANGTVYTTAISVGTTTTLKAIAYKTGMTDSDPVSATYTIQLLTVANPSFSPSAGTYSAAQSVAISSATVGATIRYTTDGSNPSETVGTIYTTAVNVSQNTTLKAIAYKTDMINSGIVSGVYNIKCASPAFGVAAGTYNIPQSISLTSATSGATIRYTTDGSTPSQANGTVYTTTISVGTTTTLKAIAYKTGMTDSDPVSADYIVFLDMDGDGVGDNDDEFQNDSVRAFNNYFPANGPGTLVFEDSWPSKGDYDMNDVVVDYQFRNIVNSNNKLVETYATFVLKASGAGLNSGFGFQFPNSNINASDINVSGYIHNAEPSYINVNNNGTEANQDKPTIVVFDNVFKVLQHPGVGTGINTTTGLPYVTPVTITIHITYTNNTYNEQQLDIAHFNPFIIINKVRGKEVHLPDYSPTSLANPSFFGTIEDNSNVGLNRYYKTKNNLPWALNLYESFSYPTERTPINEAYNHFIDWVISNGTLYTDWYKNNAGNINNSKIFTHQVKSSVSGSKNINNDNIKVITDKIK